MKRKDVLPLCDIALTAESRVEPPVPSCHRPFPSMRNWLPGRPSTQLSTSGTPPKVRGQMPPASKRRPSFGLVLRRLEESQVSAALSALGIYL